MREIVGRSTRDFSLLDQARALAVVLQGEFGAPFTFYHAGTGEKIFGPASGPLLSPEEARRVAASGQASVTPLDGRSFRFALLLYHAAQPSLVAAAEIDALATSRADLGREEARLQRWVQSVADRLRLSDQVALANAGRDEQNRQALTAWEGILSLDQLLRRVRIHKDPARNQRRILEGVRGLLKAQTLVWVPRLPTEPVQIEGEPLLTPGECRKLVGLLAQSLDSKPGEPFLCNDVGSKSWSSHFPQLANVLAFSVIDQGTVGYVLALNKGKTEPGVVVIASDFRRTDAALLAPFVSLLGLQVRTHARYQDLKELLVGLTRSLTAALDAKDSYTYGHSERVARIAVELGRELGLEGDDLSDIYLAGLLHDVGKIGIRDAILCKREPLTSEEFEHIKQHVTIGYNILAELGPIRHLLPGVLHHHEQWNGTGYPERLAGDAIPLLARILAVADAYDAMSTTRPYREAMPCRQVEEILTRGAGKQWDQEVINAFLRCRLKVHAIRQRGVGESLRSALEGALNKDASSVVAPPPTPKPRGSGLFRRLASPAKPEKST